MTIYYPHTNTHTHIHTQIHPHSHTHKHTLTLNLILTINLYPLYILLGDTNGLVTNTYLFKISNKSTNFQGKWAFMLDYQLL